MSKSLPPGWRRVRLGDVLEQVSRVEKVDPEREYRLLGVRWYANGCHLHNTVSGRELKTKVLSAVRAGDVTYNKMWTSKGAFGVVKPEQDGFGATSEYPLFAARDGSLSPAFIECIFRQPRFWDAARALCRGTTQRARLNPNDFLRLPIELPMPCQQERIVNMLGTANDAIKANEEVIARTQEFNKILTNELITRGLPGRHSRFKDSPIERIPADWRTSTVGEVGRVQLGRQRSPAHQTGKFTRPYLRVANVFNGYINYTDVLEMDFDDKDFEMYCLYPGDLLLNEGQSRELVGRPAIFDGPPRTYCFQNTLVRFRPADFVLTEFALAYFQMCLHKGIFAHISRQTTSIAHLGAERFSRLPFPVPTLDEQREISITLNTSTETLRAQADSLDHLTEVRMDLGGALLSGGLGNFVVDDF